jgi:hypothetical protein
MKNVIITIGIAMYATSLFAQKDETLFDGVNRTGAWGAPIFEILDPGSDIQTTNGGGGGLVLNDFFLGGYGMGTARVSAVLQDQGRREQVNFKHGGFWLGYTPLQHKVIHPYASARMGWGKAKYAATDNTTSQLVEEGEDSIFAITPEAGIEVNIFSFFRVAATASYRHVNGFRGLSSLQDEDLSGFGYTLTLRIGGFGKD